MSEMKNENHVMANVGRYMNTKMVTIDKQSSVLEAAKAMADRNISSVAITSSRDEIVGIITERDIVKLIANGVPPDGVISSSLMSSPVLSIMKDAPVEEAAQLMLRKRVRHLLVLDSEHNVVGIITATDLARYLKQITAPCISPIEQQEGSPLAEVWELFF